MHHQYDICTSHCTRVSAVTELHHSQVVHWCVIKDKQQSSRQQLTALKLAPLQGEDPMLHLQLTHAYVCARLQTLTFWYPAELVIKQAARTQTAVHT